MTHNQLEVARWNPTRIEKNTLLCQIRMDQNVYAPSRDATTIQVAIRPVCLRLYDGIIDMTKRFTMMVIIKILFRLLITTFNPHPHVTLRSLITKFRPHAHNSI